jgi:hypothetical protein
MQMHSGQHLAWRHALIDRKLNDSLEVLHFATLSMEQLDDTNMGPVL